MYQLQNKTIRNPLPGITRIADGAFIPPDPGNIDWVDYQNWLKAGNTPLPAPPLPPDPAPLTVTEKLAAAGLTLDELKAALAEPSDNKKDSSK